MSDAMAPNDKDSTAPDQDASGIKQGAETGTDAPAPPPDGVSATTQPGGSAPASPPEDGATVSPANGTATVTATNGEGVTHDSDTGESADQPETVAAGQGNQKPDSPQPSEPAGDKASGEQEGANAAEAGADNRQAPPLSRLTPADLGLVSSVQVTLTLNVGSKSMAIEEVINLRVGSVVTLNRREHEPLDVMINDVLFARGEVVSMGEYYGLRILEIL